MNELHSFTAHNGQEVRVRFLERRDGDLLVDLFNNMSPDSRYHRFHVPVGELSPEEIQAQLPQYLNVDRKNHVALLAIVDENGREIAAGVARFKRHPQAPEAESAIVVRDEWQRQGVGTALLLQLAQVARSLGIERFVAVVQANNRAALRLVRRLGGRSEHRTEQGEDYIIMHLD